MENVSWVMYAGIVTWAGIGLYLFLLAKRQTALSRRVEQLAALSENE